jgi:EAL domain-containing protein (putative c-di-GMP-specific phosphodiesterase class I)/GAF domain-containing protein
MRFSRAIPAAAMTIIQDNETARLNALRDLKLLDTPPSDSFDRLTRMASKLFDAPVSTISLTDSDRQWFKSRVGVDLQEIPRDQAPCAYAIKSDEVFVVPDMLEDERFSTSPLAQAGIRFYAGAPLITRSGYGLGTLCIVDTKPRAMPEEDERVLRDLAGLVMAQIELQNTIGRVDATTGHANQHQFLEDIEDLGRRREGGEFVGLLIELAASRQVSHGLRVLGATYAEELIRAAAAKIGSAIGRGSKLYQVGPTRCLVLMDAAALRDAGKSWRGVAADLDRLLREPVECSGIPVTPEPAIGAYVFSAGAVEPRDVLRRLFGAVDDARDAAIPLASYDEGRDNAHARSFTLLSDLPRALAASDELSLVYQPRIDIASGQCIGAEALLRWRHPELGPVPPGEFIPLAEATALVGPLTDWVMETAVEQAARWRRAGQPLRVSVNASALNLEEHDFAARLARCLDRHGVGAHDIELEFTESALARDLNRVLAQLEALQRMGVAVAIDDFGTGYASLSYLQQLPANIIKVDRSFVQGLATNFRDQKLVRATINMAHDLGYRVVAEGVESEEAYRLLADWRCDELQGYHICRPVPAAALDEWIAEAKEGPASRRA